MGLWNETLTHTWKETLHLRSDKNKTIHCTQPEKAEKPQRNLCFTLWVCECIKCDRFLSTLYCTNRGESTLSAKPYQTLFLLLEQASSSFSKTATYCEGRAIWPKISISSSLVVTALYQGIPKMKRMLHTKYDSTSFYLLCGNVIEQTPRTEWKKEK